MTLRSVRVGSGITEHPETRLDDLEADDEADVRRLFQSFADSRPKGAGVFEGGTHGQALICDGILRVATKPYERDSVPYLAQQYLHLRESCLHHLGLGEADHAAERAWNAGMTFACLEMKLAWERPALSGARRADALKVSRERRNRIVQAARGPEWKRWNDEAADIWRENPRLTKNAVAAIVQKRLGLTDRPDTIARRLKKPRTTG